MRASDCSSDCLLFTTVCLALTELIRYNNLNCHSVVVFFKLSASHKCEFGVVFCSATNWRMIKNPIQKIGILTFDVGFSDSRIWI